ncbi:hypothetical protein HQ325_12410 [Rhodococcus sp. BP-349]|uniref:hypothetical protein n=1 Tax=unclassified Rhodococcus (in: high G+C Gram-positive bacteria) TaxID=192944 RepID=UPI001C9A68D4|nr:MULTISPECIES: hypothetical protein [unclassified Rhodococcus (in: high G+C Gram-positive bacteria)]MBY6539477.1 hypothetical protein [Rhodococcus sp. BP-363]MBY6544195.1 hypothetical protein [Rhodococcus sp. BP-369]MBY6563425.1 hypothetical protein [Rhodococcus sp. BP-370]MBY6577717.1 hypothetical protein [Rhodococcus sp. BP-364]MBY6587018.1 hypothetical protein [Rhodococcus sp. BP-358]
MTTAFEANESQPPTRRPVDRQRRVLLMGAGGASCIPVLDYTVTGLTLLCVLVLPGVLVHRMSTGFRAPVLTAAMGCAAYAVSAEVNDVHGYEPNRLVYASIVVYLMAFGLCCRDVGDVCVILVGISMGTVVFALVVGTPLSDTGSFADLWKYGIANAVTVVLVFVLVTAGTSARLVGLCLVVLAVVSLALNYRSHALVCVIVAVVVALGANVDPRRSVAAAAAAVVGFGVLLPVVSGAGIFGDALAGKVSAQEGEGVPLILAGRTESPLSLTAIGERPFLGWGSATAVPERVFAEARLLAVDLGFSPRFPFQYTWRGPENSASFHSVLLGSWAEGGVVAALFPLWLLAMCVLVVTWSRRVGRWAPLVCVVAVQAAWDLLFSPWTYNLPAVLAAVAVLCVVTRGTRRGTVPS